MANASGELGELGELVANASAGELGELLANASAGEFGLLVNITEAAELIQANASGPGPSEGGGRRPPRAFHFA